MGRANPQQSYYIERTPPIAEFVRWAVGLPPDRPETAPPDDPADDPPALEPWARLLSVIGPPGCGKTWFLVQFHAALAASLDLIVLPLLDLKRDSDPRALWNWFVEAIAVANTKGIAYPLPQQTDNATVLGDEVRNLCVACGARHRIVLIVLVDGFEDIGRDRRQDIESFLAGILMADNAKIVLTRRDEQALNAYPLRCSDEQEVSLSPLPSPEEQIRQRLERAGWAVVNWSREPWEDELDQRIATLTAADRTAVLTALAGNLTPNPYISARLLALRLEYPHLPLATLKRLCLESYLERARLNTDYVAILEELVRIIQASGSSDNSFTAKQFGGHPPQSDQHEALMVAGIISHLSGTSRYQLDSAVAALI